jgi:uncharacterized small protein (DUF1192 family)
MSGNRAIIAGKGQIARNFAPLIEKPHFCYGISMFNDENEPRKKPPTFKDLERLSLDELDDYIAELKAEIVRTEEDIKKKKAKMAAASTFFKT